MPWKGPKESIETKGFVRYITSDGIDVLTLHVDAPQNAAAQTHPSEREKGLCH